MLWMLWTERSLPAKPLTVECFDLPAFFPGYSQVFAASGKTTATVHLVASSQLDTLDNRDSRLILY